MIAIPTNKMQKAGLCNPAFLFQHEEVNGGADEA
jgi:hypothetical protein